MKLTEILNERASAVLYHFTTVGNATGILESGVFRLSADQQRYNPKAKRFPYYMSAARSKKSGIHNFTVTNQGNDMWIHPNAVFILDGEWFNRNPKVTAKPIEIDNYNPDFTSPKFRYDRVIAREYQKSMMEDRIWSMENELPNDSIVELHFTNKYYRNPLHMNKADSIDLNDLYELTELANLKRIPWWMYNEAKDIMHLNKARAIRNSNESN